MDLNYSSEETAFRDEVRTWLSDHLPAELRDKVVNYRELTKDDLLRWHKILAEKGWVAPEWPREWGGTDWTVVQRYIFEEEMGYAGCPTLVPFGLRMCAPVLFRFGTDACFPLSDHADYDDLLEYARLSGARTFHTVHGFAAGTDSTQPWAHDLYLGAVGAVAFAAAWRALGRPMRAAPERSI